MPHRPGYKEKRSRVRSVACPPARRHWLRARLRERDGDLCCHCQGPMQFDAPAATLGATIEHGDRLFAATGGFDLDQISLAHRSCNQERGSIWHRYLSNYGRLVAQCGRLRRPQHFHGYPALREED